MASLFSQKIVKTPLNLFVKRNKSNTVNVNLQRFEYKPHRSHRIKPYIRIDPSITVQGKEIDLLPLPHGLTDITRKQLEPGDEIEICRKEKGFDIEQRTFKDTFPFPEYPQICPCIRETVLTRHGEWLYCTAGGKRCLGVLLPKLKFFIKHTLKITSEDLNFDNVKEVKKTVQQMDEENEGEEEEETTQSATNISKLLRLLVQKRIVQSIPDIFRLKKKENDIVEKHKLLTQEELDRLVALLDEKKLQTDLPSVLHGLSIMVQRHAILICEQYRSVDEMLDTCTHFTALKRLEGVENQKAHEIFVGMSYMRDIYPELRALGLNFSNPIYKK